MYNVDLGQWYYSSSNIMMKEEAEEVTAKRSSVGFFWHCYRNMKTDSLDLTPFLAFVFIFFPVSARLEQNTRQPMFLERMNVKTIVSHGALLVVLLSAVYFSTVAADADLIHAVKNVRAHTFHHENCSHHVYNSHPHRSAFICTTLSTTSKH